MVNHMKCLAFFLSILSTLCSLCPFRCLLNLLPHKLDGKLLSMPLSQNVLSMFVYVLFSYETTEKLGNGRSHLVGKMVT